MRRLGEERLAEQVQSGPGENLAPDPAPDAQAAWEVKATKRQPSSAGKARSSR